MNNILGNSIVAGFVGFAAKTAIGDYLTKVVGPLANDENKARQFVKTVAISFVVTSIAAFVGEAIEQKLCTDFHHKED